MERQTVIGLCLTLFGLFGGVFFSAALVKHPQWAYEIEYLALFVIMFLVGVLLVFFGIPRLRGLWMWSFDLRIEDAIPFRRLIPVNKALQRAFDSVQGTVIESAARELGASPLDYMFFALKTPGMWGVRPPSRKMIEIPQDVLARDQFDFDLNAFRARSGGNISFEDVHMLRRDLYRIIADLKRSGRELSAQGLRQ